MKEWFEQSFGKDYLITYRHRDELQAKCEVISMINWLRLPFFEGVKLLDIGCGTGRHSLVLKKLGFTVTGFDLSEVLLSEARDDDEEGQISWMHGDMRRMPFKAESFDVTLNLFTSFGYFEELEENEQVIANIAKILMSSGAFIIDFLNPLYVKTHYEPHSERIDEQTGCHIEEIRQLKGTVIEKKIIITPLEGKQRNYVEQVTLLPLMWFQYCFEKYGLYLEQLYGNYLGEQYEENAPRMIMIGRKLSN